ncbi:carbohydrate kinase [Streptomyces sp. BBFR2]|uniref:carbohydrate kinase family protein n=1 Tax=Streptomyces sp. BBFR2 TaxID=3372854 RepID=UPI0037DA79CA
MIVVAGEALIDLVPAPRGGSPEEELPALLPRRGGGPYNTAIALGRLGSAVAFCSRLSRDTFGTALLDGLHAAGVEATLVQRGDEPTTLAVADISPGGSAGYGFYADGTADRLFTVPEALPDAVRALSFGTCSLVLEPGATAYETLLRREAGRGLFTALDPNVRPALIPDPAAYRARFRSWLPYVTLLKLSEEDARWLAGAEESCGAGDGDGSVVESAVREWLAAGPAAVVLTRGGDGLTVWTEGGSAVSVPAVRGPVVDTIGAGDTVNAALLHRLHGHDALSRAALTTLGTDDWRDILTFAARAAALTCARAGAEPPWASELTR